MKIRRSVCFPALIWTIGTLCLLNQAGAAEKDSKEWRKPDVSDVAYGDHWRNTLDIYKPDGVKKGEKRPVLLFVHGGAWMIGDKGQYPYLGNTFSDAGYLVVSINYRLYPDAVFPDFVEDGASAVVWIRKNIAEHGGDPDNIFLMGHSAGGHIVALLGADERYLNEAGAGEERPWLRGVIPIAGPHKFDPSIIPMLKPVFGKFAATERPSPANFIDGKEPPFLVMYAGKDHLVEKDQGEALIAAIKKTGGHVEPSLHPDEDHISIIFSFSKGVNPKSAPRDSALSFMDRHQAGGE